MGLETGTQIGDLVPANPPGTDPKSQGDDHLRLIKTCVQGSLGNMESFWEIPTVGPGLSQKNTAGTAAINLINLASGDTIDIGAAGIPNLFRGDVTVSGGDILTTGTLTSGGALVVNAGGMLVTGDSTIDGNLEVLNGEVEIAQQLRVLSGGLLVNGTSQITGAFSVSGGFDVTLSSGSNLTMVGGSLVLDQLDSSLNYSLIMKRTGVASGNFVQMENDGAVATYRPIAFMVHDDAGAIRLGSANTDNTFVILENTIRLGNLPDGASGLTQGDLYHTFGNVQVVL